MITKSVVSLLSTIVFCLLASFTMALLTGCQEASALNEKTSSPVSIIKVKTDKGCVTVYDAKFAIKPPPVSANDDADRPNHCKISITMV
jgi:hypothetical protein